jgi:RNA polymerase sigma factor (sigma-70 family)
MIVKNANCREAPAARPKKPSQSVVPDALDLYLRESRAYPLLSAKEQDALLSQLIHLRAAWQRIYLNTEAALEAVWADLLRFRCGEIAAVSLVPGPPRPENGRPGPNDHVDRLHAIFTRHRDRHPKRPFRPGRKNTTGRLVTAVIHLGLRPRPMDRYREAALASGNPRLSRREQTAHDSFLATRKRLVEHNLRLVFKVARQFFPGPMPLVDLVQEGNIGLIRATESFNHRFGVRFSTYAHLWIRQAIIRALEDKSRTIRLPVSVTQKMRRLQVEQQRNEEPANEGGASLESLMANPTVGSPLLSLDVVSEEHGDTLAEIVPDEDLASPDLGLNGTDVCHLVRGSLALLPERQRLVLRLRFGLGSPRTHTLSQIGSYLGISAERVRQIQEKAFRNLRTGPEGRVLEELVVD